MAPDASTSPVDHGPSARGLEALSPEEVAVLMQMDGEIGHPAAYISANLAHEQSDETWSEKRVRHIQKSLHRKGYADFGFLTDEDGLLRGRGYWLCLAGQDIRYGNAQA